MPLIIIRNDITKMNVDAIVNAANSSLLGGGGVDGAIHRAAGPGLLAECRTLGGCETGEAKLTRGYDLPAKYVIHTVGPIWRGGRHGEKEKLVSCYKNSLALAKEAHCETVAFPLISAGVYGYPKDAALRVAEDTIAAFLTENEMTVYIVIFDRESFSAGRERFRQIREYIDDRYAEEFSDTAGMMQQRRREALAASRPEYFAGSAAPKDAMPGQTLPKKKKKSLFSRKKDAANIAPEPLSEKQPFSAQEPSAGIRPQAAPHVYSEACEDAMNAEESVAYADGDYGHIRHQLDALLDESFSEMLLRKIDERGMTDAECYKKANIDRKLFSKIRSDRLYKPSKPTVLAFAIALELSLPETRNMLMKAGFALSHSNKFDIIVEYFIERRNYNIFEINEALFAFDQALLGA